MASNPDDRAFWKRMRRAAPASDSARGPWSNARPFPIVQGAGTHFGVPIPYWCGAREGPPNGGFEFRGSLIFDEAQPDGPAVGFPH